MTTALAADDLNLSFGGLKALDGISIKVESGTITGLIGPNGAGKTTTFNVISGLQRSDSGRIHLRGDDVTGEPAHRRARMGVRRSFQNLGLIDDETVLTNVLAAQHTTAGYKDWDVLLRPSRWRRGELDIRARAEHILDKLDLQHVRDVRVSDLSFAAARFTEIAAVLATEPDIVLLDEPTTGLDVREVQTLAGVLTDYRAAGNTVFVVAHDVQFVMSVCDYVYVLAEGALLAEGVPQTVQRDPAVIEAYLGKSA